jgi:hypothetical protein
MVHSSCTATYLFVIAYVKFRTFLFTSLTLLYYVTVSKTKGWGKTTSVTFNLYTGDLSGHMITEFTFPSLLAFQLPYFSFMLSHSTVNRC